MFKLFSRIRLATACLGLSILMHTVFVYASRMFGTYDFSAPVSYPQGVFVDLAALRDNSCRKEAPAKPESSSTDDVPEAAATGGHPVQASKDVDCASTVPSEHPLLDTVPAPAHLANAEAGAPSIPTAKSPSAESFDGPRPSEMAKQALSPLRSVSEFVGARHEKLTYMISMLGMPVGSAELEASNDGGQTSIRLRVRSNDAIAALYPVDDVVETRLVDGRFIMTEVKQREGSFRSDETYSINLRKKRVSWTNHLRNGAMAMTVPADDVLDTLSGLYYLRNRRLEPGRAETLHIYDSEAFADVPVEVLRREETHLSNLKKVDTLVVRPLQKSAGIFRRTGDLLVWMTDDDHKVPVKIVTSIALGKVTAELVSAESKPHDESTRNK